MNIVTNGSFTIDLNKQKDIYVLELNDGEAGIKNKIYLSPISIINMMEQVKKDHPSIVENYKAIKESMKEAKGTQAEGLINLLGDDK